MGDTTLSEINVYSRNDRQNIDNEDIITLDFERRSEVNENNKVQKEISTNGDRKVEEKQIKDNDVSITLGKEFLKPYIYVQGEEPIRRKTFWVQYVGGHVEPMGDTLDYSPESRNSFVLLVFSLVFIMLSVTAGLVACVIIIPVLDEFFRRFGLFLFIPAAIILVGMGYAMSCSSCTRVPPCNFICLLIVVLCMSIITAFITRKYSTLSILYAFLATTLVVVVCMCLACSRFDFTKYLIYVVVIGAALGAIALVVMLGMLITGTYIQPLHLAILVVLTLVQVILLTMELQMILGGKTVELGEDDYAFGAYMLYTSILDIFIKMVQMIGMFE